MMPRRVDQDLVMKLSEEGLTVPVIAQRAGCSRRAVSNVRKAHGFHSPRFLSQERLDLIEAKLDDGWSYAEIERTLGHDVETIERHFPGRAWTREQMNEYNHTLRVHREGRRR